MVPFARRLLCLAACLGVLCSCGSPPSASAAPSGSGLAARVGSDAVSMALFSARLQNALTSIQQAGGPATNSAMLRDLRASVLRSLILDAVIAQEAAFRGLQATDAQVSAQVDAAAQQEGGAGGLQSALAQAGGSITQLRDEIMAQINEQRLEDYFAKQRAQQVEQQLAGGAAFASLAMSWSDDSGTSAKGGDLGALTASELKSDDAAFGAAVRALAVGTYTTTPVHDAGGYDVIQVYARTPATVSVRHILVAAPNPYTVKDRPQWFAEALFSAVAQLCQQGRIHVYVKNAGSNPCSAASTVTPSPSPSG
jgi:parvulin-like peptidyl-prolyl isomerase